MTFTSKHGMPMLVSALLLVDPKKTKILQLPPLSHLICLLERSGAPHPLRFIIPGVTACTLGTYLTYQLFINARFHLDAAGLDIAPLRMVFPTLTVLAHHMLCQNCLRFTSLI
jgi:hypothetical protein